MGINKLLGPEGSSEPDPYNAGIDLENPRNIGHLNYLRLDCVADRLGTTKFTNFARKEYDRIGFVQWENEEQGWAMCMTPTRECALIGNNDAWVGEPHSDYVAGAGRYTLDHFREKYPELMKLLAEKYKEQALEEAMEKLNDLLPKVRAETTAWPVALAVVTPVTDSDNRCYLLAKMQAPRITEGYDETLYPNGVINPFSLKVFF